MQAAMLRRALRRESLRRAHARGHGGVRGPQRGCPPMPALRLAACAVGARRHVSAGRGMAREPRTIRTLRARARVWPRAAAGARRGRDDPRHHHTPVLEHGREAARCAPAERKHFGRLGSVAAWKQGGGDPGRFEHAALGGAGRRREQRDLSRRFSRVGA